MEACGGVCTLWRYVCVEGCVPCGGMCVWRDVYPVEVCVYLVEVCVSGGMSMCVWRGVPCGGGVCPEMYWMHISNTGRVCTTVVEV